MSQHDGDGASRCRQPGNYGFKFATIAKRFKGRCKIRTKQGKYNRIERYHGLKLTRD